MEDRAAAFQQRLGRDAVAGLGARREGFDPEDRFTEIVSRELAPQDMVVDIGTGVGTWLLANVAALVRRAVGFDYSARRLWLARQQRADLGIANVEFLLADGRRVPLGDGAATVLINRRGPWTANEQFFLEGLRVLHPAGRALEISIGEENGRELGEAFGARAQMCARRAAGRSCLDELVSLYRRHGLTLLVAESHVSSEVFSSREALEYFLITTPAIEGFDAENDAALVDRVIGEHGGPDGVRLTVHRLCLLARRSA